ncbi:hypothetical protein AVEN_221203-1 [Araneus ventricosus]|uniref:Uncharacterized protein n=1 Tax=Araneus ventricosus TaxID=182803 RepID=A0A4Y2QZ86_ARAVE|nr:hypothetical protein AVEN_221203-1 [Araneus ventricosus]
MHPRSTIKSLTFEGQTSWAAFKTQFDVVNSTNGWKYFVKASQLVALLRGVPEVPGQFRYAVKDFSCQVSQKGVLVAATLVDLEKEAIPVRFLNLKNKPKILDKGAVTATCEEVMDIVA